MNPGVGELLRQGAILTVLGMSLVFIALALLWGLMTLLSRLFRQTATLAAVEPSPETPPVEAAEALTAERARVAAIVAGALMANAVPLLMDVPAGPTFEHGRTAPAWVTANRARTLFSWQPPRVAEGGPPAERD